MQIELRHITKRYSDCLANDNVSLSVAKGEIHALLGENGAGKSTLMKIIYGVLKPDEGAIVWQGKPVVIDGPAHARRLGIGMVFQHFSLFESLTVAENIALSLPASEVRGIERLKKAIREVSVAYGMPLEPDRLVHTLSVGEKQRVEIVRCLMQNVRLLILDEPTSVLTPQEVAILFDMLRKLASEGCSILFISHKLEEVRALCDSATILRSGVVTGQCVPRDVTTDALARMMVGEETPLAETYTKGGGTERFLRIHQLSHSPTDPFGSSLRNISLDVHSGEIVGIAGVAGNGQQELLRLLSGETLAPAGSVWFRDRDVSRLTPEKRRRCGLGFVPEERVGRGAVPAMDLEKNSLLTAYQGGLTRRGVIRSRQVRAFARSILTSFQVRAASTRVQAGSLSGGNLQKFIIGREILQQPELLVCAHPTWGVDVGAAIVIRHALVRLRDQGAAILIVSEDIDELFSLCDRLCVLYEGRISPVAETRDLTIDQLGRWMTGDFSVDPELVCHKGESR